MKKIFNWRKASIADIEADALLDDATKIHVLSCDVQGFGKKSLHSKEDILNFFEYHIDNDIPIVMHNGICYDIPLVEKIYGVDLSKLMIIDTLILSWYLNFTRSLHGLDSFFQDYGIAKPKIDDWENLSIEEYTHRCEQDVEINLALWKDLKGRLINMYSIAKVAIDSGHVGGKRVSKDEEIYLDRYVNSSSVDEYIDRVLTFLMHKQSTVALREKCGWKIDKPHIESKIEELSTKINEAKAKLESVMDDVPNYKVKNKPKKPTKKDGTLSASGLSWNKAIEGLNIKNDNGDYLSVPVEGDPNKIKVLDGYKPPNANSPDQVKALLFKHGWEPRSFNFVDDKDAIAEWKASGMQGKPPEKRKVPQISVAGDNGKELCQSVIDLSEECPEVMAYSSYTLIKHRLGLLEGFLSNEVEGKVRASVGGLTNTFRDKHRGVVNLPSADKPYGKDIRGSLICEDDQIQLGSDLSSLEDRVKHHFMLPHDPNYVHTMMAPDFDPHILTALQSGFITEEEFKLFKEDKDSAPKHVSKARKVGKSTNYACLPLDKTEVLTDNGWVMLGDVEIGTSVLGYDTKSGTTKFTKVLNTIKYGDRDCYSMSTISWGLEATSDHRWYVNRKTGRGGTVRRVNGFKTTEELKRADNIISSAPYEGGYIHNIPYVRLFSWALSDGYIKVSNLSKRTSQGSMGQRRGVLVSIAQSERKYADEIRKDLLDSGLEYSEISRPQDDVRIFTLRAESARKLFSELGVEPSNKCDINYTKFLLSLSQECLVNFVDAFWKADGLTSERSKKFKTKTIYQNRGALSDAVVLACELIGRNTYQNKNNGKRDVISSRNSGHLGMQKTKVSYSRRADVGCLTTGLGTFVIRQNNLITITGNCVYSCGVDTLARTAGIPKDQAAKAREAYWELNWSVEAIAKEQTIITDSLGNKWLINPVNGFLYNIRKEKDIFSTLCQGTGSFFFDMWVSYILDMMEEDFGVRILNGAFHDEYISIFYDHPVNRQRMEEITKEAIQRVNKEFKLRRELDCDVQFGKTYADIH